MKKISYLFTMIISLFYFFISWNTNMSSGESTLLSVSSLIALVGSIGGLSSKPWAKRIAFVGISGIGVLAIYRGGIVNFLIVAFVGLLLYLGNRNKQK